MRTTTGVKSFTLFALSLITSNISYGEQAMTMPDQFHIQTNQADMNATVLILKTFKIGSTTIESVKSQLGSAYTEVQNFGPKGMRMESNGSVLTYYFSRKTRIWLTAKQMSTSS